VAQKAILAGASIFNDVSALTFDPASLDVAAKTQVAVCLMHASATPQDMQSKTSYDNVVLDVYDYLEDRIEAVVSGGIKRQNIIVDPGIGFGKTVQQNLALIRNISMFHGLGVAVLLGASRKSFIGKLADADAPKDRMAGSIAAALCGFGQGVQITRVHDVKETRQAFTLAGALASEIG